MDEITYQEIFSEIAEIRRDLEESQRMIQVLHDTISNLEKGSSQTFEEFLQDKYRMEQNNFLPRFSDPSKNGNGH